MGLMDRLRSIFGGGQTPTPAPTQPKPTPTQPPAAQATPEGTGPAPTPRATPETQHPTVSPQSPAVTAAHNGDAMMAVAVELVGPNGSGLNALLEKLKAGGLREHVDTWVGTGGNMPPTPKGLAKALGQDEIADIAQSTGLSEETVSAGLAEALPQVIDKLTPEGMVPDADTLKRHYDLQFKR